jgi:periplasmic divalent cation tolerance protein
VDPNNVVVVLTTLPVAADADAFARTIVNERLAACVSMSADVRSVYRWEGAVTAEDERQIVIKTTAARVSALRDRLVTLHPYSVPEFLVLNVSDGGQAYLEWVRESVAR